MKTDARFAEFVARHSQPAPIDNALDWDRERDEWLAYLDALYVSIAQVLAPFVESGTITLHQSEIDLNEENIGTYAAKRLMIAIGPQEISLMPVGTLLIGSKGRVDVQGSAGSARLVLVDRAATSFLSTVRITMVRPGAAPPPTSLPARSPDRPPDWVWKIVGRPPTMQFVDLDGASMLEMLMDVSGG